MSYIGKTPTLGNFVKLDALTASATASYTMQVDSVNFSPESVNHMLVSLNGVIQSPTTSYTISGSTITFASALTSSDSIDFIMVYGNVLDIGTPSDATVTNAKTNFVSTSSAAGLQIKGDGTTDGTLQLNCSQNSHGIKLKSPPHSASASYTLTFPNDDGTSGQALTTDGSGVLTWATAGGTAGTESFLLTGGGSNQTISGANAWTHITCLNTEKFDVGNNCASDTFTAPTTGKYLLCATVAIANCSGSYLKMRINTSNHNHEFHGNGTQGNEGGGTGELTRTLSIVTDMDASDTAKLEIYSDVTSVVVQASDNTYFSGCRIA